MRKYILLLTLSIIFPQYSFSGEDINSSSSSFGQDVGPSFYPGSVTLYYFGHQN